MNQNIIVSFIDKYTNALTIKHFRNVKSLIIFLTIVKISFTLTIKSWFFVCILLAIFIAEYVYMHAIIKRIKCNKFKLYDAICVNTIFTADIVFTINISLYSIQKILGTFDIVLLIIIFAIEIICVVAGFLYMNWCIRRNRSHKPKAAAGFSIFLATPGVLGYFITKHIIDVAPLHIQSIFFSGIFALVGSMMMFCIGMIYVTMIYLIKKYNISNKSISVI